MVVQLLADIYETKAGLGSGRLKTGLADLIRFGPEMNFNRRDRVANLGHELL